MKLSLSIKPIILMLSKALPLIVGVALVVLLGYTAYLINAALNLQPGSPTSTPQAAITYDKKTIHYIQTLKPVPGQTGVSAVGKSNPFGY